MRTRDSGREALRLALALPALVAAAALAGESGPGGRALAGDAAPVSTATPTVPADAWALVGSGTVTRAEVERRRRLLGALSGEAGLPAKLVVEGVISERVVTERLDREGSGPASVGPAELDAARAELFKMLGGASGEAAKRVKDQGLEGELDFLVRVSAALKKRVERDATDAALRGEFEKRKLLLADGQVRARDVVVAFKGDEAAASARAQLALSAIKADGSNAEEIARRTSDDPMAALTGGDTDFFGPNPAEWRAVRPEVIRACFELGKPGPVAQPVKARDGFHVLYVTEVRVLGDASYEKHADTVRNLFLAEHGQELVKTWRDEAKVVLAPDAPK